MTREHHNGCEAAAATEVIAMKCELLPDAESGHCRNRMAGRSQLALMCQSCRDSTYSASAMSRAGVGVITPGSVSRSTVSPARSDPNSGIDVVSLT